MTKSWFAVFISLCLVGGFLTSAQAQNLQATATTSVTSAGVWNYTFTNSEPTSSGNYLTDFYLPISAPITNVQTANGWTVDTDYTNFIQWSNTEPEPFPNDIEPGLSVSGFSFTSVTTGTQVQYTLASWDHSADAAGPDAHGTILAPYAPAPVPEVSTWQSLGALLLLSGLLVVRRPHSKRG